MSIWKVAWVLAVAASTAVGSNYLKGETPCRTVFNQLDGKWEAVRFVDEKDLSQCLQDWLGRKLYWRIMTITKARFDELHSMTPLRNKEPRWQNPSHTLVWHTKWAKDGRIETYSINGDSQKWIYLKDKSHRWQDELSDHRTRYWWFESNWVTITEGTRWRLVYTVRLRWWANNSDTQTLGLEFTVVNDHISPERAYTETWDWWARRLWQKVIEETSKKYEQLWQTLDPAWHFWMQLKKMTKFTKPR